jgi:NADH-quinone oxidoreductase subunit L
MLNYILFLIWGLPMVAAALGLTSKKLAPFLSVGSIFVSFVLSLLSAFMSKMPYIVRIPWFSFLGDNVSMGMLFDGLSIVMGTTVALVSFLISVYSYKYMENDWGWTRYWFFFTFFVGSMMMLIYASNLVVMLVGWEGTTLASYALIGHWYTDEPERWVGDSNRKAWNVDMSTSPSHAGIRAMVFTSLADVGFITGIGMLYYASGTISILGILNAMPHILGVLYSRGLLLPFLIAFTLGAFGKSAQFPFHEWLVTAMTGPTSISALIHAATMVNAGVYFLLRFTPIIITAAYVAGMYAPISSFFTYILLIGALTAFMMASMAVSSNELKLILAYSTSSQLGYMFMAIGAAYFAVPTVAIFASMSHLISQAIFKAALFMAAGVLIHEYSSRYIKNMGNAWKNMKYTGIAFLFAALSLSGIPPFSGFWDKDLILDVTLYSGNLIAYALGIAGAFLTAFYIFRAFKLVFINKNENAKEVEEAHPIELYPYLLLGVLSLVFGIFWYFPYGGLSQIIYRLMTYNSIVTWPSFMTASGVTINASLSAISVIVALAGIGLALYLYAKNRELNIRSPFMLGIQKFLYDRWYINAIYYRIFVNGTARISSWMYGHIEWGAFDKFYHALVPRAVTGLGSRLKNYQRGNIGKFISTMIIGGAILLIILIVAIGVISVV